MKFWRRRAKSEAKPEWMDRLPPGFLEEGDRLVANAWAALGVSKWGIGDDEITIEVDNRSGKYTNLPAAWSAPSQTDQPRTWTAPMSGRYHVVSKREPHLIEDCTEECA